MTASRVKHAPGIGKKGGQAKYPPVSKKLTGIAGFDQITGGGLPVGRCTTVMGGPGTGKTLFALQNLLHRLRFAQECGLFVTFEEPADRVRSNVAGLDWGFDAVAEDQLRIVDALVPVDTVQAGAFDLCGLLACLSAHKAQTGACNVVFDGLDILLSSLNDEYLERRELTRIDEWIRAEDVTAVMTAKSLGTNERELKRADLIQYLTDCVVHLDAVLCGAKLSRTLRVLKYRGSGFSGNAVPMAIGQNGIEVIPDQVSRSGYPVFSHRVSSGVPRLDSVLGGGYVRGSSILLSGAPGTSKTSLAVSLVAAGCAKGGKAVFVSFDESSAQTIANMESIGLNLQRHVASRRLIMTSLQSSALSPEECFIKIWELIRQHEPDILVVDPLSAFSGSSHPFASAISENLIDLAKSKGITFLGTSLLDAAGGEIESSASHVSTVADTWIHVSYVVQHGERNRALTIIKSRGTSHSNQVRELELSNTGIDLLDVDVGEGQVLLGSARLDKKQKELESEKRQIATHQRQQLMLDRNIAELQQRAHAALEELASKRRESALEKSVEDARLDATRTSIAERRQIRRQADDKGDVSRSRRKRVGQ